MDRARAFDRGSVMAQSISLLTGKEFAPLSTAGNKIVDQDGEAVFIKALNWYGMELDHAGVPVGVEARSISDIMQSVVDLGFDTLRLPFSTHAVLSPFEPTPWFQIDYAKNPELLGANTLEVIEHVVDEAAAAGLSVIISNHNADVNGQAGHWYDSRYSEDDWVDMWQTLAGHLADKPNVIAADLRNEPFAANWNDWSTAAERAGNAVHSEDPGWLIVVEGVHHSLDGDWYQWAGNLKDAANDPVVLNVDNKVVYSPHEYPAPVLTKLSFEPWQTYYSLFDEFWGNLSKLHDVPVLIGEFGFNGDPAADGWVTALSNYIMGDTDGDGVIDDGGSPLAGWAYWNLNPPELLSHNLFETDLETVRQVVWEDLEPLVNFEPDWVGTLVDGDAGDDVADDDQSDEDQTFDLDSAFEVSVIVHQDWGNGASIEVFVRNVSGVDVDYASITVELDAAYALTARLDQIWNATLLSGNGGDPVFRLQSGQTDTLVDGETASFFVVADYPGQWNQDVIGLDQSGVSVVGADPLIDNTAPSAQDFAASVAEDGTLQIDAQTLLALASDEEGGPLTISSVSNATVGSVSLDGGVISYTPPADFAGEAQFFYTVRDGIGATDTATVTVTVDPVNDDPVAGAYATETEEGTEVRIAIGTLESLASDVDGDAPQVDMVFPGANGTAVIDGTEIVYMPDSGFSGTDAFSYTIIDGAGGSDQGVVTVTVEPAPDEPGPTPSPIAFEIIEMSDWGTGAFLNVRYTNVGNQAIAYEDLALTFSPDTTISLVEGQVWGGSATGYDGETATFTSGAYDPGGILSVGESQTLSFVLSYGGEWNQPQLGATVADFGSVLSPAASAAPPVDTPLDLNLTSVVDWGNGVVVELSVTNAGPGALDFDDFAIAFDGDDDVFVRQDEVFGATLLESDPDAPAFRLEAGGATSLASGETATFTFVADYNGVYNSSSLGVSIDDFSAFG
ncbi:MAG: tandem-95 repeat protein [Pseudomonadota bacterium]